MHKVGTAFWGFQEDAQGLKMAFRVYASVGNYLPHKRCLRDPSSICHYKYTNSATPGHSYHAICLNLLSPAEHIFSHWQDGLLEAWSAKWVAWFKESRCRRPSSRWSLLLLTGTVSLLELQCALLVLGSHLQTSGVWKEYQSRIWNTLLILNKESVWLQLLPWSDACREMASNTNGTKQQYRK